MKKFIAMLCIFAITLTMLPATLTFAETGDVYPGENIGPTSNNAVWDALKSNPTGTISQTSATWRYQYAEINNFSLSAYKDLSYKNASNQLQMDETNGYPKAFQAYNIHPSNTNDFAITFIAPKAGYVEISNAYTGKQIVSQYNGDRQDGVLAKILKNETQLWPSADWASVAPAIVQPTLYTYVNAGDKVFFRINKKNYMDNDGTFWNPTVKYVKSIYFEKQLYYAPYIVGGNYDNLVTLPVTKLPGIDGDVVYESSDISLLEPTANPSEFLVKGAGQVTITAKLMINQTVSETASTSVLIKTNNIGGPYNYDWNGAIFQGPVWYYKALVPSGEQNPTSANYVDMTTLTENTKYNFFTIGSEFNYGYMRTDNRIHPGIDGSPTFAFKAPRSGYVKISANLYPNFFDSNSKDGIRYRICHNDKIIYPLSGSFKEIPLSNINIPDNYGEIVTEVKKDDFIYFTLDKNANETGDLSAWSPKVTYFATSYLPNELGLTDSVALATTNIVTDGGVQNNDSLQLAAQLGKVGIAVNGATNNSAGINIADASSASAPEAELFFENNGYIDITLNDSYNGSRTIKDLDLILHSKSGVGSKYNIDLFYSKTSDKDNLIHFYSAAETNDQTFIDAFPYIRLKDFNGKLSDVYKIRVAINAFESGGTRVAEIDMNTETDDTSVSERKQDLAKVLRLPSLYGNNMILQRDKPIKIWGYGGTDTVNVALSTQDGTVVRNGSAAVTNGRWSVDLNSLEGGHTPYTLKVTDPHNAANKVEYNNILVGDIWVASGQSNMDFPVSRTITADDDVANAIYSEVRYFGQRTIGSMYPLDDPFGGNWTPALGSNITGYSAVAYNYARELYEQLGKEIPIGIMAAKMSGTGIQSWVPEDLLSDTLAFKAFNNLKTANRYSSSPYFEQRAVASYNAMLFPLTKVNIKGVIWYQGENNGSQPDFYKLIFPQLIKRWRTEFRDDTMPFHFVQLPSYNTTAPWQKIREIQLQASLTIPHTGMAVITDLGTKDDIHPTLKRPVGQRLAYSVAALTYNKNIEYSGPMFDGITKSGDKITIAFSHTTGGLVAKSKTDGTIDGFELSSDGVTYSKASAVIVGDTVEVSGLASPVSVRYGWASNYAEPALNLFNGAGLPASPFRADTATNNVKPSITYGNQKAIFSGTLSNKDRLVTNPAIVAAIYDSSNKLVSTKLIRLSVGLYDSVDYTQEIELPQDNTLKIFTLNSLSSLEPLTDIAY